LTVGEGLYCTTGEGQYADWTSLPHQRNAQSGTSFAEPGSFDKGELWIGLNVLDLHGAARKHNPADYASPVDG
jgi:hypothetical protein